MTAKIQNLQTLANKKLNTIYCHTAFVVKRAKHTVRAESTPSLIETYTNREIALKQTNPFHSKTSTIFLGVQNKNVAGGSNFEASTSLATLNQIVTNGNKGATKALRSIASYQTSRRYRITRSFLRRVRNFRLEARRNLSRKTSTFGRTKVLAKRGGNKNEADRSASAQQKTKYSKKSNFALTTVGLQNTRISYKNQTQPIGLEGAVRVLSFLTGTSVSVHRINGLALARLGLDRDKVELVQQTQTKGFSKGTNKPQSANSARLLAHLRETTGNRLGTSPTAVPDLVRLPFTALYIKAAPALAERLANGLRTLPRQRKETAFLRSLRKLVKVLAALRPERLGLRIRLQGRVNR
jgi:hypothetical protein